MRRVTAGVINFSDQPGTPEGSGIPDQSALAVRKKCCLGWYWGKAGTHPHKTFISHEVTIAPGFHFHNVWVQLSAPGTQSTFIQSDVSDNDAKLWTGIASILQLSRAYCYYHECPIWWSVILVAMHARAILLLHITRHKHSGPSNHSYSYHSLWH